MNELKIVKNNEFKLKIIMKNNDPWFVAKEVSEILGYSQTQAMIKLLDADEMDKIKSSDLDDSEITPSSISNMRIIINESGLYNAIFGSTKPNAKAFKKWVTSEVLPSIRRTGEYKIADTVIADSSTNVQRDKEKMDIEAISHDFESAKKLATLFDLKGNQAILKANILVKKLHGVDCQKLLEVDLKSPRQELYLSPTEIGKQLIPECSGRQVNKMLEDLNLQVRINGVKDGEWKWSATRKGIDLGAMLFDTNRERSCGIPIQQLKWASSIVGILQEELD